MKKQRYLIVLLLMVLGVDVVNAQQDAQYTHYMYNTSLINPAYVGSRNTLSVIGMHRSQWIGLEGAPTTQVFTINSALGERQGIGASFFRDAIGPAVELSLAADISYSLPLNSRGMQLAFGLKVGFHSLNIDFNKLLIYNPNDPPFQRDINDRISPIIGAGFYLHTDQWYAGISIPNFLKTRHYNSATISRSSEKVHLYLMGGYVFELTEEIQFKPASLIKITGGAPISVDLSANFIFHKKFSLGASYRASASASFLGTFQASEHFSLGYSYDYPLTTIGRYSFGSHEILLRYELPVKARRPKYLRCF